MPALPLDYASPRPPARTLLPWIQVVVAALAMVGTLPGRTMGLGLVATPLLQDLRLSEVDFGWINLIATLVGAAFALGFGQLIDRVGVRPVLVLNTLLLAAATYWMSRAAGFTDLAISLTLVRGLGQSALSVAALAIVGKWFTGRRLTLAMAVFAALVSILFVAAFAGVQAGVAAAAGPPDPVTSRLPHPEVWRAAWAVIAYSVAGLAVIGLFAARAAPVGGSQIEQGSDTADVPAAFGPQSAIRDPQSGDSQFTLSQALATRAFWTLALACAAFNLIFSSISLFSQPILIERGFPDLQTFQAAMGLLLTAGLVANFLGGWLGSRVPLSKLLAAGMAMVTASLLILPYATTKAHIYAYASLMGLAGGVVTVVFFACWPKLFGRPHLGLIQGAAQVLTVLFSALGPLVLAWGKQSGSFSRTFLMMAPFVAILAVACWLVPVPRRSSAVLG
ncbi:MAG TPA: MFS transporter [Tepidisphaeraceae bacterium]|nr:MFS transporter [Tepidisphaeraceae bacterium]